jgi:hypothetical protein
MLKETCTRMCVTGPLGPSPIMLMPRLAKVLVLQVMWVDKPVGKFFSKLLLELRVVFENSTGHENSLGAKSIEFCKIKKIGENQENSTKTQLTHEINRKKLEN